MKTCGDCVWLREDVIICGPWTYCGRDHCYPTGKAHDTPACPAFERKATEAQP